MIAYEIHNENRYLLFKAVAKRHGSPFRLIKWSTKKGKNLRHGPIHVADLRGYRLLSVSFPQDLTVSNLKSISGVSSRYIELMLTNEHAS